MIYLRLRGRIGNQLFMYAFCKSLQFERGDELIVVDDFDNLSMRYANSLVEYNLPNTIYVNQMPSEYKKSFKLRNILARLDDKIIGKLDYNKSYQFEKKMQKIYNRLGLIKIRDGYIESACKSKNVYVDGYFQTEKYFEKYKQEIRQLFSLDQQLAKINYPDYEAIKKRNTVCISIKVEDNANNPMYDVCTIDYYKKAIKYIQERVDNPLFFVCSDNVEYVKQNLIDTSKYDIVEQDKNLPVHLSLAVMSKCKHFIITNSSFAWWAQNLSDYEEKIVIAPSKWYGMPADWQWDIYQEKWVRIEV